jgi:hypothetical protein
MIFGLTTPYYICVNSHCSYYLKRSANFLQEKKSTKQKRPLAQVVQIQVSLKLDLEGEGALDIFQCFSARPYTHLRNSREGLASFPGPSHVLNVARRGKERAWYLKSRA